ncbi:MAG TPA: hypothetical protein VFE16_05270 [Candidatus Cybelea sp.]|jgi:nucleoside phosphorylase|nr:hypothetical protein [Candidatus Cybelea sp.]
MASADAQWLAQNTGFKILAAAAADAPSVSSRDFARKIIDFDSEGDSGKAFLAQAPLSSPITDMKDIPWSAGMKPIPAPAMAGSAAEPLPEADVVIVTWTMDEGHTLSRVLTPGFDSDRNWKHYTHNYEQIASKMRKDAPALEEERLGTYWLTQIAGRKVLCFKSDSHLSQDGPATNGVVPNAIVWKQIITEARPKLVITTGTGGGIGLDVEVGDVVVSEYVHFDCQQDFKNAPFHDAQYKSPGAVSTARLNETTALFAANAGFLPKTNSRPPKVLKSSSYPTGIVTTDFFGFDCTANTFKLRDPVQGRLSEMGDAVLGMVCKEIGAGAPPYIVVRNVSDPEIKSDGLTEAQQQSLAGNIYMAFGKWSTVCSAITCCTLVWSL